MLVPAQQIHHQNAVAAECTIGIIIERLTAERGYLLAVIETVRRYHISRGTGSSELSWILEDNQPMRHMLEEMGAIPYKTYRIYEKAI